MALPQDHDLPSFIRGDSYAIPLEFIRDGNPEDLTGWSVWFTVKNSSLQPDTDAVIRKQVVIGGSAAVILLLPSDSAALPATDYVYDIQVVSASGEAARTLVQGKLIIAA